MEIETPLPRLLSLFLVSRIKIKTSLALANATFVEEDKWNGLHSTKLMKKNVSPEAKTYSLPCPFILSIIAWAGGLPWRHRGPFPYWLPRWSQRVTRKVETRCCRGFFLLFLLSPLSLRVCLCSSPSRLISTARWFLFSGYSNTPIPSLLLIYHPKYMIRWYAVGRWQFST